MSHHRDSSKGDNCTTTTVTLCNGALKNVQALQERHFSETKRYLKVPKAVNLLLAQMKVTQADLNEMMQRIFDK